MSRGGAKSNGRRRRPVRRQRRPWHLNPRRQGIEVEKGFTLRHEEAKRRRKEGLSGFASSGVFLRAFVFSFAPLRGISVKRLSAGA